MKPILYAVGAAALAVAIVLGLGTVVAHHDRKLPAAVQQPVL